jgi:murein L,D-transpeptidase YafK
MLFYVRHNRKMKWIVLSTVGLIFALALAYAHWPTSSLPADVRVDKVLVIKSARKLVLLHEKTPIKEYRIALGGNPLRHKTQQGDQRTPEGQYVIDYRKKDSSYHRALHISYPNARDRAEAHAQGVDPGGLIMIHGIRNGFSFIGRWHRLWDWTDGCIALTNAEIEELWDVVPNGTPIEIRE